jgi:hypothetical protein
MKEIALLASPFSLSSVTDVDYPHNCIEIIFQLIFYGEENLSLPPQHSSPVKSKCPSSISQY